MTAATTTKRDQKKELGALYAPPRTPVWVEVPPLTYLMIDGVGDPNTAPAYAAAVAALYAVSYTLKFALKRAGAGDYAVMPLEGLWWADDMTAFIQERKEEYRWTMMIAQPPAVTPTLLAQAVAEVERKKGLTNLGALRLETLHEGRCAQVLHIGPYSAEGPTIAALHGFIREQGATLAGRHHEIYLGDPRRGDPAKLKTIIRQPVAA